MDTEKYIAKLQAEVNRLESLYSVATKALNSQIEINERLKEKNRWIPVSERLPKEGLTVLTLMESGYIGKCEIIDDEWQHLGEDIITYWKPIVLLEQALKENK